MAFRRLLTGMGNVPGTIHRTGRYLCQRIEQKGKALSTRKSQFFVLLRFPFLTESANAPLPPNLPSKDPEGKSDIPVIHIVDYPIFLSPTALEVGRICYMVLGAFGGPRSQTR
jgi:hypothetical protein